MAGTGIYVAIRGASGIHDGKRITIVRGRTTVREGHPLLRECPDLFAPLTVDFDVEPEAQKQEPAKAAVRPEPKAQGQASPGTAHKRPA